MSRGIAWAGLVLLAGCTAERPENPAPAPTGPDACGASKVVGYIGKLSSEAVLAKISSVSGAATIRVVGPHDAMTMDYREDRLTVTTGEDGRIKTLRCV